MYIYKMIIETDKFNTLIKFSNEAEYIKNVLKLSENYQVKKVAILYSGNIRSFSNCIDNHLKVFEYLKLYGYTFDIFYQNFKNEPLYNKHIFKDGITTDSELDFNVNEYKNNNLYCSTYQNICQIKGYYDVFQFLINYQKINNIYYECVLRFRYDSELFFNTRKYKIEFDKISIPVFLTFDDILSDDKYIYTPSKGSCSVESENRMFNDRLFYGRQHNMYIPMNAISFVNNYDKIHAETMIGNIIVDNNLKIFYVDKLLFDKKRISIFDDLYPENKLNIFCYLDDTGIKVNIYDIYFFIYIDDTKVKIIQNLDMKYEKDIIFNNHLEKYLLDNIKFINIYYNIICNNINKDPNTDTDYYIIYNICLYIFLNSILQFIKRDFQYDIYLNFDNFLFQNEIKNYQNVKNIFYINNKLKQNKYYNFMNFMEKNVMKKQAVVNGKLENILHMTYEKIDDYGVKHPLYFIWF